MKYITFLFIILPTNLFAKPVNWVLVEHENGKIVFVDISSVTEHPKQKVSSVYVLIVDEKTESTLEGVASIYCKNSVVSFAPVVNNELNLDVKVWAKATTIFEKLGCDRYEND